MSTPCLWVIMPVYNEESALRSVLEEWLAELRVVLQGVPFVFAALDDGSRDQSLSILKECAGANPELRIISKTNSGHGQTCMMGYRMAAEAGSEWILQIDSDGQCDPRFFRELWALKDHADAVFGFRRTRRDGVSRKYISRILAIAVLIRTGTWVRDPNSPYRLMCAGFLKKLLPLVPGDVKLANVFLSVLLKRAARVRWVDIAFRARSGGISSVNGLSFVKEGLRLMRELRTFKNARKAGKQNGF